MKRFCQTLTLVNDEKKIAEYVDAHKHVWPEIIQGQREVGILDMQIYRHDRQLFMIWTLWTTLTLSAIWLVWLLYHDKQNGKPTLASSKAARQMHGVRKSGS